MSSYFLNRVSILSLVLIVSPNPSNSLISSLVSSHTVSDYHSLHLFARAFILAGMLIMRQHSTSITLSCILVQVVAMEVHMSGESSNGSKSAAFNCIRTCVCVHDVHASSRALVIHSLYVGDMTVPPSIVGGAALPHGPSRPCLPAAEHHSPL